MLPNILVVEDDKPAIVLFEHYLRNIGKIDVANDGEIAIDLINNNSYDLILMDINLRGDMDGLVLTRYLRDKEEFKNIPIIAVTAFGKYYKDNALSAGCNYFLIKPFEKSELLDLVSKALNK